MTLDALLMLLGLEVKHFLGDYVLQFERILKDKRSLTKPGGYIHAAIHAVGTILVFMILSVPTGIIMSLVALEFVVHFLLDFTKARLDTNISSIERPRAFWALNGLDQMFHHASYLLLAYLVARLS